MPTHSGRAWYFYHYALGVKVHFYAKFLHPIDGAGSGHAWYYSPYALCFKVHFSAGFLHPIDGVGNCLMATNIIFQTNFRIFQFVSIFWQIPFGLTN